MALELGKALSFFLSIASLYALAANAFFGLSNRWSDRLGEAFVHLAVAALVCFGSGLLFNDGRRRRITATLPVRLFFWALAVVPLLFFASWYITCGNPLRDAYNHTCG